MFYLVYRPSHSADHTVARKETYVTVERLCRQFLDRFLRKQPPSREGDSWSHDSCDSLRSTWLVIQHTARGSRVLRRPAERLACWLSGQAGPGELVAAYVQPGGACGVNAAVKVPR